MLVNYVRTAIALKLHSLEIDRRAVTAIEYALIAALIAVVIIGSVMALGNGVKNTFSAVASELLASARRGLIARAAVGQPRPFFVCRWRGGCNARWFCGVMVKNGTAAENRGRDRSKRSLTKFRAFPVWYWQPKGADRGKLWRFFHFSEPMVRSAGS